MGLALPSCPLIHAAWGELLTMLSQPPMMQDLAELVFLGGQGSLKTKAQRGASALAAVPAGCLQSLVLSKVTARVKPWVPTA